MRELIRHILREHTREICEGGTGVKQTKQQFIDKGNKVHRNKYDYSKVDYINSGTKVEIICPEHGSFFQTPRNHIAGQGCRQCGLESNRQKFTKNSDKFKEQANLVHNNKYDYSKVEYSNNHTPVEIICPEHGSFFQRPSVHLKGSRCPECGRLSGAEKHTLWSKGEVYNEASKYETISDFQKGAVGAYVSAIRNGWMDDIRKNFKILKKNWSREEIQKIANNYLSRGKFCSENSAACAVARRKGWYEDIVKHMEPVGNKYNRAIYVFEFPDHSAYIGLTGNLKRREKSHMEEEDNSAVLLHMNRTGQKPLMKILSDGYINFKDAQNMESCMLEKYKSEGWKILNRAKTGSLGSCTRVWTLEMLKELVKKYDSRTEFVTKEPNAYAAAARNGWLDDVFKDMKRLINPNNTWTYEVVAKEAAKYNKKSDFAQGSPQAYSAAKSKGWFEELTKNYTGGTIQWDFEKLKKESGKYKSKKEFATKSPSAYNSSLRQGLINIFFPYDKRSKTNK